MPRYGIDAGTDLGSPVADSLWIKRNKSRSTDPSPLALSDTLFAALKGVVDIEALASSPGLMLIEGVKNRQSKSRNGKSFPLGCS
jgi:hypothetical protein